MEWIAENISEIGAVLLAAYALARTIVILTPTPKDDKALEQVNAVLRGLGKVFGLDLKQGINSKPSISDSKPSKAKMGIIIYLLLSLCVTGCSPAFKSNPEAQLLSSQKSFAATVRILTDLQMAGEFEPEETEQISMLIHAGEDYLVEWQNALEQNESKPNVIYKFNEVMRKLFYYQLEKGEQ